MAEISWSKRERERGHSGNTRPGPNQLIVVTSHGAREAPSVHVSPRGQETSHTEITVKIERAAQASERKCDVC